MTMPPRPDVRALVLLLLALVLTIAPGCQLTNDNGCIGTIGKITDDHALATVQLPAGECVCVEAYAAKCPEHCRGCWAAMESEQ